MSYNDLIELDDGAEMIDLGIASLETEGTIGTETESINDTTIFNVTATN